MVIYTSKNEYSPCLHEFLIVCTSKALYASIIHFTITSLVVGGLISESNRESAIIQSCFIYSVLFGYPGAQILRYISIQPGKECTWPVCLYSAKYGRLPVDSTSTVPKESTGTRTVSYGNTRSADGFESSTPQSRVTLVVFFLPRHMSTASASSSHHTFKLFFQRAKHHMTMRLRNAFAFNVFVWEMPLHCSHHLESSTWEHQPSCICLESLHESRGFE